MIELSYKIKLAWVVVLHKSNRHTHDPEIITRDVCRLLHIDGIVVVVLRIFLGRIMAEECHFLMTFLDVEIGEPADVPHATPLLPVLVDLEVGRLFFVMLRYLEPEMPRLVAEPHLVVANERKYLAIGDGVHVADDEELLFVFHHQRHVFAEEGERRVRDDDVRLVEERDAFRRAEVAVAFQHRQHVLAVLDEPFHVGEIDAPVAVDVGHLVDDDLVGDLAWRGRRSARGATPTKRRFPWRRAMRW